MKINKDLVDAIMMLSFISLVLVGTTDPSNPVTWTLIMGGLGLVCIVMVVLRVIEMRQAAKRPLEEQYD